MRIISWEEQLAAGQPEWWTPAHHQQFNILKTQKTKKEILAMVSQGKIRAVLGRIDIQKSVQLKQKC